MVQNFIFKTSDILESITTETSKRYQFQREQWLSEALQNHQSSVNFIHSVINENEKMYLQSFVTFTQNELRGIRLVFFQQRRFQSFISEILRVISS